MGSSAARIEAASCAAAEPDAGTAASGQEQHAGRAASAVPAAAHEQPLPPTYEVHYSLDPIAGIWVAHLVDSASGEVLRSVPSTELVHELAACELRHVDAHV
jgi:hypothetical protein